MNETAPLGDNDWQGWQSLALMLDTADIVGNRYTRAEAEALVRDCRTIDEMSRAPVGFGRADSKRRASEWDGAVVRVVANACRLSKSGLLDGLTYAGFPTWRNLAAALENRKDGEWRFSQDDMMHLCGDMVAVEAACTEAMGAGRADRPADAWTLLALAVHAVAIVKAGAAKAVAEGAMRGE